jgi:TolB protein
MRRRIPALVAAGALAASALAVSNASPASSATFPGTNCKIAYVRKATQSLMADVYVMSADGTGKTNLTNLTAGSVVGGPTWTPDGTKIAYSRDTGSSTNELVVMNADGSSPTVIDSGVDPYSSPTYSPDGSKIAFTSADGVYVINSDGTSKTKIVNDVGTDSYLDTQFAPGGRLAYRDAGAGSWVTINADGTGATPGTWSQFAEGVSFSPDGTKVLYPEFDTSSTDMYVSNLDGTGVVLISTDTNGYEDEGQSWSPDGTKTVWTQEDAGTGNYQVMLSNPDGTGLVDLTQEPTFENTAPAWGPGGAGTPCASPVVTTTTTAASSDPSTPKFTG